jgi:hypothetical protein
MTSLSIVVALTFLVTPPTWAGEHSGHVMLTPADLQWTDIPSLPRGAKLTLILSGMGPWGITYVNPADDPRKK